MNASTLVASSATAFAASALFMVVLQPLARHLGLLDRPGGHKTHDGEVPVIGGIAMYMGLAVATLLGATLAEHGYATLGVAVLMVLVGGLDDRFNLPPVTRLYAHLMAAILLVFWTGFIVPDLGNLFGMGVVDLSFLDPVFTVVACVALVNAFNMLDGLDGLAGSCALMGCAALTVIAFAGGGETSAVLAASMVGTVLGFLIFNMPVVRKHPFRAFMGDAGSTLLGFIIAALALTLVQTDRADVSPVLIVWIVAIPIFELFATTFRRLLRGSSPLEPDNGHFHHVLRDAGLSVRVVFVTYLAVSAVTASFAVWAHREGVPDQVLFAAFVFAFFAWMLAVHNVRRVSVLLARITGQPAAAQAG